MSSVAQPVWVEILAFGELFSHLHGPRSVSSPPSASFLMRTPFRNTPVQGSWRDFQTTYSITAMGLAGKEYKTPLMADWSARSSRHQLDLT